MRLRDGISYQKGGNDMQALKTVFNIAYDEIEKAGITTLPPKANITVKYSHGKKTLGVCKRLGHNRYQISISRHITTSYKAVIVTMIHEILHTAKDCFNHGRTWQRHASRVNAVYGYSISRTVNKAELGLPTNEADYNYKITCGQCGKAFYRLRESKLTKHPFLFTCKCGGKLSVTKLHQAEQQAGN